MTAAHDTAEIVREDDAPMRSNRVIAIVMVAVLMFGAGVVGWRIGHTQGSGTTPGRTSVDVGFFQDMSTHHNQAIGMAFTYLEHGTDPLLGQIASEILTYQAAEIGVMGEYLGRWSQSGTETDRAMEWMGMSVARDEMAGLATQEEMRRLAAARGAELNQLFTRLMIDHHLGGVHMAEYAAEHATTPEAKRWGASMVEGQLGEIAEMNQWRVRNGFTAVKVPDSLSRSHS